MYIIKIKQIKYKCIFLQLFVIQWGDYQWWSSCNIKVCKQIWSNIEKCMLLRVDDVMEMGAIYIHMQKNVIWLLLATVNPMERRKKIGREITFVSQVRDNCHRV